MIIKDHLFLPGLCGFNPLVGKNDSEFGPRFPGMGDAYDLELQKKGKQSKLLKFLQHLFFYNKMQNFFDRSRFLTFFPYKL